MDKMIPATKHACTGRKYHQLVKLIDDINGLYRIPSQGGLHLTANISGCTLTLSNKLALSDVGVYPSSHFSQNNSNSLLFGFVKTSTDKIEKAFSIIRNDI
ncbi:hypothetical protein [Vibrio cidicii]|uniref:hypothetical protein n=1 Tax=Vibrio cidicii TaxID=1763883 RepID=UPI001478CC2A|nr:hypothetical protein [Vibrio cidicii]